MLGGSKEARGREPTSAGAGEGQGRCCLNLIDKVECVCLWLSGHLLMCAPLYSRKVLQVTSLWVCACDITAKHRAWHVKALNKRWGMLSACLSVAVSLLLCKPALRPLLSRVPGFKCPPGRQPALPTEPPPGRATGLACEGVDVWCKRDSRTPVWDLQKSSYTSPLRYLGVAGMPSEWHAA